MTINVNVNVSFPVVTRQRRQRLQVVVETDAMGAALVARGGANVRNVKLGLEESANTVGTRASAQVFKQLAGEWMSGINASLS